jgi:hypothetical protein
LSQKKSHSVAETIASTAIGFAVTVALSMIVYPAFGHGFTVVQNMGIASIFTVASLVRGYIVRRAFNRLQASTTALTYPTTKEGS